MKITHYMALPDLVSLANASSGFLAVIMVSIGNLILASQFMLLAVIFDSIDGWVARRTNRVDEHGFGKNMDSLSDVISFGVAPGMLLFTACQSFSIPYINILVALLIVISGILRLSRFNVLADSSDVPGGDKFVGLPIPTTALILGSFYLSGMFRMDFALIIMAVIAVFMISTIEYPKFKSMILMASGGVLIVGTILPQNILSSISYLPAKLLFLFTIIYVLIMPLMELYGKLLRSGPHVR
ncbi:archaetidylserine synthase [Methanobacterium ferruginis]|jgi:archaetidylserine synthase|uniref:archaetidylserine synthase n=1 Tax=Methanobacterium ferruginis TaxID=710191 RepID=UPI002573D7E6|nr:archaetidylserine synthase [Methanobacterium ferruginis]MCC7550059.1 archaetidylserine synthase [Methanobacterium sp.]BDZ67582.1 CDP-diacylglycerol--serine O-phosphatidyltransferase [Methanobacterium ferruginis]